MLSDDINALHIDWLNSPENIGLAVLNAKVVIVWFITLHFNLTEESEKKV